MSNDNLKNLTDETNSILSDRVSLSSSKFKMSGGGGLNLINSHTSMSQETSTLNKSSLGSHQVFFTEGFKNEPLSPKQQFPNFNSQPNQQQQQSQLGSPGLTYNGYNSQMNFNNGLQQQMTG